MPPHRRSFRRQNFLASLLMASCLIVISLMTPWTSQLAAQNTRVDDGGLNISTPDDSETPIRSLVVPAARTSPTSLWGLLTLYALLIAAASLFGGWLPGHLELTHVQFQLVLSLIGGLILGIGILHLLPHAVHQLGEGSINQVAMAMLAGMLAMFFLLRTFHVHHHEPAAESTDHHTSHADHAHGPHCQHDHSPEGRLSWLGLFFGLTIHTLLDGLALGATMQSEALHGAKGFVGLGILLAITLHKPLDSLSITTLMIEAHVSSKTRWMVNVVYALLCPIGAALFLLGMSLTGDAVTTIVGYSLAFSAGVFLCISLADLLPEMEFHSHHRFGLSIALLLGIAIAWGIRFLEPAHLHH